MGGLSLLRNTGSNVLPSKNRRDAMPYLSFSKHGYEQLTQVHVYIAHALTFWSFVAMSLVIIWECNSYLFEKVRCF